MAPNLWNHRRSSVCFQLVGSNMIKVELSLGSGRCAWWCSRCRRWLSADALQQEIRGTWIAHLKDLRTLEQAEGCASSAAVRCTHPQHHVRRFLACSHLQTFALHFHLPLPLLPLHPATSSIRPPGRLTTLLPLPQFRCSSSCFGSLKHSVLLQCACELLRRAFAPLTARSAVQTVR